jgi:ligand-binding sensor protein
MEYSLQELIDVPKLQELLDSLYDTFALPTAIVDRESNVLTLSGWQKICVKYHRANPATEKQCRQSDQYISSHVLDGNPSVTYRCPMGLIDIATPIIIDGNHLGNVFIGQLFLEKPDVEYFRRQAKEYGFEEEDYLEALTKVPVFSKDQLEMNLAFIRKFTEMLGEMGLKRLKVMASEQSP